MLNNLIKFSGMLNVKESKFCDFYEIDEMIKEIASCIKFFENRDIDLKPDPLEISEKNELKRQELDHINEDEKLLVITSDGQYEITDTELTQRFDPEKVVLIEKFNPEKIVTAVYLDNDKLQFNIKRFNINNTTSTRKCFCDKQKSIPRHSIY